MLATRFRTKILNSFVSMFEEHALELCQHLQKMVGKGSFDAYHFSEGYTLNAIFGIILIKFIKMRFFFKYRILEAVLGEKVNIHTTHSEYALWIDE